MDSNEAMVLQPGLVDKVPAVIFEVALDGTVVHINEWGREFLRLNEGRMAEGINFFSFLPSYEQERVKQNINDILATGQMGSHEYDIVTSRGETRRIFSTTSAIYENGKPVGLHGVVMDLTERREKETRLAMFQKAVETSICGVAVADMDTKLMYVNPSLLGMWGYDRPDEVLGSSSLEFWAPGEDLKEPLKELMRKGKWSGERRGVKKDGTVFPMQVWVALMYDADGNPAYISASLMDISDLKNTRDELAANNELLQQKNIALQELIRQVGREREEMAEQITGNVRQMLLPLLTRYRRAPAEKRDVYLDLLTETLKEITSPFNRKLGEGPVKLTQREMEICNMIKSGLATKEIAGLMHISVRTVEIHRNNIRKKLSLSGTKANLQTYLRSL